jgi:protein-S-isoprenylcysteine O-methyltransferase Ste14
MIKLIVLLVVTAFLLAFTIVEQRAGRAWAWARFITFECCFILVYLNAGVWFLDPFSPVQIISWVLLALSIYLALQGFLLLKNQGQPDGHFEHTTTLVITGIYKYIRHPMYASLFYFIWGALLKGLDPATALVALTGVVAAVATARIEEKLCQAKFGDEYRAYMKTTRMFIPFVF